MPLVFLDRKNMVSVAYIIFHFNDHFVLGDLIRIEQDTLSSFSILGGIKMYKSIR